MPRNSNKRSNKIRKTRKQKLYMMRGCSKKSKSCKKKNIVSSLGNKSCPNCGPNCHCGPNCNCPHKCPGSCYLNNRQKGGYGCGSCGCPIAPLSVKEMNQFGGVPNNIPKYVPNIDAPVLIEPPNNTSGYIPIPGVSQNGGSSCSACGKTPVLKGGNFFKPSSPIPGPFVGSSWGGSSVNDWPGVNGISGDKNYNASYNTNNNIIVKDPQLQMSMNDAGYKTMNSKVGGYTYKKGKTASSNSNSIKGGGLVPQDLVNLGRDFSFNLKSAYNAFNGYNAPTNPLPYKDQLRSENSQFIV